jgi:anti-anti-sigma factor
LGDKLTVRTEPSFPVATVEIAGALDIDTAPIVRNALRKHVADQPAALIVDLSGLLVHHKAALSVLRSAIRTAGEMPGIPIILLVPDEGLRDQLRASGMDRQAPIVADRATALDIAASMEAPLSCVLRDVPCSPASLGRVREVTRELCGRWGLDTARDAVVLAVCELVTNALEHARTSFDVTVALRGRYVHLAVRDGSTQPPRQHMSRRPDEPGGRGLLLVADLSASWGYVPIRDGKLVWATIPSSG